MAPMHSTAIPDGNVTAPDPEYRGEKSFTLYLEPSRGSGRRGKRFELRGAFESVIYPDVWESPALIEMRAKNQQQK